MIVFVEEPLVKETFKSLFPCFSSADLLDPNLVFEIKGLNYGKIIITFVELGPVD